jgi:hypothetical protein
VDEKENFAGGDFLFSPWGCGIKKRRRGCNVINSKIKRRG